MTLPLFPSTIPQSQSWC